MGFTQKSGIVDVLDQEWDAYLAEKRVLMWHKWWMAVVRRQLRSSCAIPKEDFDGEMQGEEKERQVVGR